MAECLRFGPFAVDLASGELSRSGLPVPIQRQPFEILALLLERPGRVVPREELRARLWPDGTFVDFEHGLNTATKKLRRALGDSSERPRFVETLPRRGYRFIAAVHGDASETAAEAVPGRTSATLAAAVSRGCVTEDTSRAERFIRAVAHDGGEVVASSEADLVAVFESPDDALRCAFAMQRSAIPRDGSAAAPALGIGISLGNGTTGRAEAVRLCGGARAGEILCARALSRRLAETSDVGFREVATGDGLPAGACAVVWDATDPAWLLEHAPFVGRSGELDRLTRRLARAREGQGGVVLVSGEPGIGKTRLLNEVALRARRTGASVLAGRCTQGGGVPPYEPFAEALAPWARGIDAGRLREYLGAFGASLARLVPLVRERLPDLGEPPALRPDEERLRIFDAVARLLESMAKREPVLLLLDDLQWADGATLALLEYLARLATQTGVLLVGAYRDVEIRREHPLGSAIAELERGPGVETLALGGLAPEPVRELLEALAGHAVPESFLETLHRATHGNPFFVRELLRQLAREGTLERDLRGRWTASRAIEGLGLPASIRALVKERIARVSEEGQRLLAAASAWEGAFPFEITYRAAGLEEEAALDALDEVLEAQLVQPSGESDVYEFGHALVRHTVYEGLASPGRVRLHRRLADEAEQFHGARAHEHAAEIAVQYHRSAGLPGAERGADHAIAAAEAAERAAALEELARFLRMALDLLPEGDERRPRILARLGVALAWSGASEEAGRVASEAGELLAATEGPGAAAEYLADVAAGLWAVGAAAVAWTLAAAGLRHAGSRRDATWAVLVSHDLDRREAEDPANPGISLDAAERRQAWELIAKTWRADDSGAPGEKAPRFARFAIVPGKWMVVASRREALERWPDVVVPLAFWAGEYRRALELNERRLTTDLAGGRLADVAWAMSLRIRLHTALGDLEAAQEALERASELAERVRSTPVVTWLLGAARLELALVRDARGEWLASGAEAMLAQDAPENRWFAAVLRVAAALGQALLGNADAALARLAETLPAIERASAGAPEYTGLICHAASVLWLLGRADHAMVLERNLRAKVLAADFRYPQVDARLALAHVCALTGRHDEARAWFARARGVLDEQGARPLRAIVDYDEALAFQRRGRRGDRTRTRPLLDAARAQFEAIGMPGWIARAEALARSLG